MWLESMSGGGILNIKFNEMDVLENTDETLYLDFHYCPLVKAWQKAGCSRDRAAL